jgi:hypothetical protein
MAIRDGLIVAMKKYNTHGHKLRFLPSKKAQFVTECGIVCYNLSKLSHKRGESRWKHLAVVGTS